MRCTIRNIEFAKKKIRERKRGQERESKRVRQTDKQRAVAQTLIERFESIRERDKKEKKKVTQRVENRVNAESIEREAEK